jgi:hypothetical protein
MVVDGRAVAIRDAVEDAGLEKITGPLDAGMVARIGVVVGRAALAGGDLLQGLLRAEDVAIASTGDPVLAPIGGPIARLQPDWVRRLSPTGADRRDGPSALYGLGVLLWTLATGSPWPRTPVVSPPIAPGVLRPGVPPDLDRAILALLDPDPGKRAPALDALQTLSSPSVDLRAFVRPHPALLPIVAPRRAESSRAAEAGGMVLLPARALRQLDPEARSMVAGRTGLPERFLDVLERRNLPVVLGHTSGPAAARRLAAEVASQTGLPVEWGTNVGVPAWVPLGLAGLGASLTSLIGAVLAWWGLFLALPVALGLSLILGLAGAWSGRRASARRAILSAGRSSAREAARLRAEGDAGGRLAGAFERLALARSRVADARLPSTIGTDIRSALKEVERRLLELGEAARTADPTVEPGPIRERLAVLESNPSAVRSRAEERDRLARTLADVEAAEAQRERIAARQADLLDWLDALMAAVGAFPSDGDEDEAVDRLARLLRDRP